MDLTVKNVLVILSSLTFSLMGQAGEQSANTSRLGDETVDQVIHANLGIADGVQTNPSLACKFEVSETHPDHFLLMLTLDGPSRMIGAHFSGDSRFFWFDSSAHTLTFDRTAIGRANVIYTYEPTTLKFTSIEEEGEDICKFNSGT